MMLSPVGFLRALCLNCHNIISAICPDFLQTESMDAAIMIETGQINASRQFHSVNLVTKVIARVARRERRGEVNRAGVTDRSSE